MRRQVAKVEAPPAPSYFTSGNESIEFFSSGCAVMDAALGGGWALGRVSNVVGDKSSGKTLIAMEACANFARQFPKGTIRYAESEAAFEQDYAAALGIPIKRIQFNKDENPMQTVEEWYKDLEAFIKAADEQPGLYIVDSLDALSDSAEMDAEFDKGSYGGAKPKAISKLFRMLVSKLKASRIHLMIISQIRDKLNVTFGETKTRSGGRALDFYASQIPWLAEIEKIKKTIDGVDRVIGVKVEIYVKKNKVGLPFRRARYRILFGYGIDDLVANAEWLIEVKLDALLTPLGLSKSGYKIKLDLLRDKGGAEMVEMRSALGKTVHEEWAKIETKFIPKTSKY